MLLVLLVFSGFNKANAQSYTFYRIIDTLLTVNALCSMNLYSSPAYADITLSGPTQVLQIDGAYNSYTAYTGTCGSGSASYNPIYRNRFFVINGVEQAIQDNYLGNIWCKAGTKIRVKIWNTSSGYPYLSSAMSFTVKISALEYRLAD